MRLGAQKTSEETEGNMGPDLRREIRAVFINLQVGSTRWNEVTLEDSAEGGVNGQNHANTNI